MLKRWWVSWYTQQQEDDAPFPVWWTGTTGAEPPEFTLCAVIDALTEAEAWRVVDRYFPEWRYRFIEERPEGWLPNPERFTYPDNAETFFSRLSEKKEESSKEM